MLRYWGITICKALLCEALVLCRAVGVSQFAVFYAAPT